MQTQTITTSLTHKDKKIGTVYRFRGHNRIDEGYQYTITFVSSKALNLDTYLNETLKLTLKDTHPKRSKTIHGMVARIQEVVALKKGAILYKVDLVDMLYYTKKQHKYQIFEQKNAQEIIEEKLTSYLELFDVKLHFAIDAQELPTRTFTIQYDQSDFDFIKMLASQEGWYIQCDDDHDGKSAIVINDNSSNIITQTDITVDYKRRLGLQTSYRTHRIYDRNRPNVDYNISNETNHQIDYLSSQSKRVRERLSKNVVVPQLQEPLAVELKKQNLFAKQRAHSLSETFVAISDDFEIKTGGHVTMQHSQEKMRSETNLFIRKTHYNGYFPEVLAVYDIDKLELNDETLIVDPTVNYDVHIEAQKNSSLYRPEVISNPIHTTLTAIVAKGEDDDTIAVNKKGQVKVHFHFDQDKTNACYLDVANMQSGNNYGSRFIPRVGSEVIVNFIDGDIHAPVITGALYNANNIAPYSEKITQSYFKTKTMSSDPENQGYNEIRFEDKRGEEFVSFKAQKDYELKVGEDSSTHIQKDRTVVVQEDSLYRVNHDQHITIGENQKIEVGGDTIVQVMQNNGTTGTLSYLVDDTHFELTHNDYLSVNHAKEVVVIEGNQTQRVRKNFHLQSKQKSEAKYDKNFYVQVDKNHEVMSEKAYELKANSAKITSQSDIEFKADTAITLNAGGNIITINGDGVHLNGAEVDGTSGMSGVEAAAVEQEEIEAPTYNLLRIIEVTADIEEQEYLEQIITFTAKAERYENDEWVEVTELEDYEKDLLNWYFIKNDDETEDETLIQEGYVSDNVAINGLEMVIKTQADNIHCFGHAHCFVGDNDGLGYCVSKLKRHVKVEKIMGHDIVNEDEELTYRVQFNIEEPTPEELELFEAKVITTNNLGEPAEEVLALDDTLELAFSYKKDDKLNGIIMKVTHKEDSMNIGLKETRIRELQNGERANLRVESE